MAVNTPLPSRQPEETNNPGQDEFDKLVEREFSPGDERMMEERAQKGAEEDSAKDNLSSDDLANREGHASSEDNPDDSSTYDDQVGKGYRRAASQKKNGLFNWSGYSRRSKLGILGGGGLLGGGIISIILLLFLPALRLEGYLAGIDQRVFAVADNAVQRRVENLFERYMVSKIIKIQSCGNNVTASCKADYSKMGLASNLFNSWQDARIEDKFFEQYGLEVQSVKNPVNGQRFKIVDVVGRFGNPGDELTIKDGQLSLGNFEGGPRIFGEEWGKFIQSETRWDQVLQRRSVRKYLTRKHGVKFWCLFACEQKDSIDNAKLNATTKLKLKLIERTITPFSQKYGLIMQCLTGSDTSLCDPDNLEKNGLDRSLFTDQDLADLKSVAENPDTTLSKILIEKMLIKMGMDEGTAKIATGLVPIAGQVYLGLSAIDTLQQMKNKLEDGTLSKIAANVTADQYVEYYTAMRSANDELKAGALSADEAGALVDQFNEGNQPAEQSLVYQAYNKPGQAVASLFGGTASAETVSNQAYTCSNGKPVPAGMLVCPEKTLNNRTTSVQQYYNSTKSIVDAIDLYQKCYSIGIGEVGGKCIGFRPSTEVHKVLGITNWAINGTVGSILSGVISVMQHLPGIDKLMSLAAQWTASFFNSILNNIFPLPLQTGSPGRDRWDGLDAGGEIVASEFNKGGYTDDGQPYGLGGKLLTDQQQADATEAYLDQQNYNNSHGSITSRIASIDNPNSVLSRFVAATPTSWSQFSNNLAQMFTRPFRLSFVLHPAYAATNTASINAFGVPRFGYTANDPAFTADPSTYTPEYCQQLQQKWGASKTQDSVTGIDEYSTTNPCLLEQAAVEAASSVFTNNDSLDQ